MYRYVYGILIALDQLGNALLAGYPDETVSTRAARARNQGKPWGCVLCRVLDYIDRNHCDRAIRGKALSVMKRWGKGEQHG